MLKGIMLTAIPAVVLIAPFLPGVIMSDGMKSLNMLAGVEVALLAIVLPVVDGLLVRRPVAGSQYDHSDWLISRAR